MNIKDPRVGVGAFILNEQTSLLLVLRNKQPEAKHWSIPGGKVEFKEKLESAIVREIKEEVGLDIKVKKLLCVTDHISPDISSDCSYHWVCPTFLVEVTGGVAKNLEPNAICQIGWFPLDRLPDKLTITTYSAIAAYQGK